MSSTVLASLDTNSKNLSSDVDDANGSTSTTTPPKTPTNTSPSSSSSNTNKPTLTRTSTTPSTFDTPPRSSGELHRQNSAAPSLVSAPVSVVASYLRHMLGLGHKTTKRSLSEEAESGSPDSISEWLRNGSDPNEKDAYGYTPLVNACMRGCIKSVRTLISHGANVNMKATHGYTPLHTASQVNIIIFIIKQI